ncbi:unnamed protein product [Tilletia laevis]|uniref:RNase H type-1 domain-containing protein n=2 Tax=Tilletia TaxID=13289 RepID=A0A9N8LYN4_9BASI|nr:unnamed protein product [Tilletia laevis]
MESIDTGIPQGSPVSPILFLIFMGPLFKLFGPQSPVPELRNVRMIGYIDDGLLYTASPSMAENCRTLATAYHEADTWATNNGLSFDDQKRELTHFPPPRQQPETFPAIELQGVEVVPTPPDQTVRWLGFHFDPKLSFVRHCQISSARARKAAQCMRMLVSTSFALRMVLPVWRTVSTDALHQEAFCLPIEFYLDKASDMAAIRLATLDDNHPLLARVPPFGANPPPAPPEQRQPQSPPHALDASARAAQAGRRFSTRLTLLAQRCHEGIERVGRRQAPWEESLLRHERVTVQLAGSGGRNKEEAAEFHRREVAGQRLEVAVYTDGSRQEDVRTGAGWAVHYDGDLWSRAKDFTGSTREVYDAEAIALWNGLRAGTELARRLKAESINIYSDNDSVLRSTASGTSTSSQRYIRAFIRRAKEWLDEGQDHTLRMEWVPGHTDVEGNEEADELANEGAEGEEEGRVVRASLAWARRKARERALERWRTTRAETAESSASTYFQTVHTAPTLRPSNALTLRRKDLGLLLQMRTGHGDFASYHERFHHLEAQTECICGERRTRFHPLRFPVFIKHQPLLQDEQTGRTYSKRDLLNTDAGIRAFLAFVKVSGAYERSRYEPV